MRVYQYDRMGLYTGRSRETDRARGWDPRSETPTPPPEVGEGQEVQWRGHVWVVIEELPESTRRREAERRMREVHAKAQERESVGLTHGGRHIDTDPASVQRLMGAAVENVRGRGRGRRWPNRRGEVLDLDASEVDEVADRVGDYLDAVRRHAADLTEQIQEAEDPRTPDLDSGWPDPGEYSD